MKLSTVSLVLRLVFPLALLLGCEKTPQVPVAEKPKLTTAIELPELGDAPPPLDEGRVVVAPPEDWYLPSRSSEWIVRFSASKRTSYPTIILTAEDYEPVFNVSRESIDKFAQQLATAIEEKGDASKLADGISPLQAGQRWGATYRRRAKVKNTIVDRVFFETVVDGRKYSFELRCLKGDAKKYRPHLLAVVAGTEFLKAEEPAAPQEGPSEEPETVPEEDPFA